MNGKRWLLTGIIALTTAAGCSYSYAGDLKINIADQQAHRERVAIARTKQGEAADRLFEAAYQKFAEALKLKPDKHEALSNWGAALLAQAETKQGEAADRLFEAAYQKFADALKAQAGLSRGARQLGRALPLRQRPSRGEAADRLFEAAYQKFAEALKLKPDMHEALSNWGIALLRSGQRPSRARPPTGCSRRHIRSMPRPSGSSRTFTRRYTTGAGPLDQSRLKTGAARQQLRRAAREKLLAAERIHPGGGAYNLACLKR